MSVNITGLMFLNNDKNEADEQRRLYYVAMTRARHTLTLMNTDNGNPFLRNLTGHESVLFREPPQHRRTPEQEPVEVRRRLDLRDIDLSYPGRATGDRMSQAIAELQSSDILTVDQTTNPWELRTPGGTLVGRLSRRSQQAMPDAPAGAEVMAIAAWDASKSTPEYRRSLNRERWEVVVPELIFARGHSPS